LAFAVSQRLPHRDDTGKVDAQGIEYKVVAR
jgi:hypothetical protein